jgi:hypothetical protein
MRTWPKHIVSPERVLQLGETAYGKAAYAERSVHAQRRTVAVAR